MQIPLDQFEQYIDEKILKRGLSYFQDGCVGEAEEISAGVFEATVSGSDNYTVQLEISHNTITDYTCDCPYDDGPVCKHIVAVIFYLQQETLHLSQADTHAGQVKNKKKATLAERKTTAQQVKELLNQVPHEDLKAFISERAAADSVFRNSFLSAFTWLNKSDSKEFYTRQVQSVLKSASGRKGFIEWNETKQAGKAINGLLALAQKHVDNENYKSAIFICTAVMEETVEALQYADDSNGTIGGCIDAAYQILYEMASLKLADETRKQLFNYALGAFEKKIFSGWDWHTGILSLAARLLTSEEEGLKIMKQLDKSHQSEYEQEALQQIKLSVLRKTKGEQEANTFMEQNLSNPSFRREAIANAIKNKNYPGAITVVEDGIKQDAKKNQAW